MPPLSSKKYRSKEYIMAMNLIPNEYPTAPYGIGGTLPDSITYKIRFFKFSFTTPASITNTYADAYCTSDFSSSNEEVIYSIYNSSDTTCTNLIGGTVDTTSNVGNLATGFLVNAANTITIPSSKSTETLGFRLNNLVASTKYYIISKTIWNGSGADIALRLSLDNSNLNIVYEDTSNGYPYLNSWRPLTNVMPVVNPSSPYGDGLALSDPTSTLTYTRYFKFEFTPSTDKVDVALFSTIPMLGPCIIYGLYKVGDATNLISTTNITNAVSGIGVSSTITIGNYISASRAFTIENLDITASYYFITQCKSLGQSYNFNIGLTNQTSGQEITLTYTKNTTLFYNGDIYTPTSIVPDSNPDKTPLIYPSASNTGVRYYRFEFTPNTAIVDIAAMSNGSASNYSILGLYAKDDTNNTNLITTTQVPPNPYINNIATGITVNTTIVFGNSFGGITAFTLNNLNTSKTYYIIVRSTAGAPGTDVGLCLFNQTTKQKIDLDYKATGTILYNNVLYTSTNIIPDINPDNSVLSHPRVNASYTRFFKFTFTPGTSIVDVATVSGSSTSTNNTIMGIYKVGDSTNLIGGTTNGVNNIVVIPGVTPTVTLNTTAKTIVIADSNRGVATFTIQNLDTSASYYIISKTTSNSLGVDNGIALFNQTTKAKIDLPYAKTGTILYNGEIYDSTNIIPDTNPLAPYSDGASLTDPGASGLYSRFFRFEFTPSNQTIDVAAVSNTVSSTNSSILGLYAKDDTSYTNLITTTSSLNSPYINNVASGITVTTTIVVGSSFGGITAFTLNNLDTSKSYYIIVRTTNNSPVAADVGLALFNQSTKQTVDLIYTATGNTYYNNVFYNAINVIPDNNPAAPYGDGLAVSNPSVATTATRYFKFTFSPTTQSIDAIASSGSNVSNSVIYGIYKNGDLTNLIGGTTDGTANITAVLGVGTISGTTITFANSIRSLKAFTINNLDTTATYYVITRTNSNNSGPDISLQFLSSASPPAEIPLIYIKTGPIIYNSEIYTPTNVAPDTYPPAPYGDGSALYLSSPGGYFKFEFTPNTSTIDIAAYSSAFSASNFRIFGIYKDGDSTNLINFSNQTNITNKNASITVNSDSTITVANYFGGILAFTMNGFINTNQKYYIIVKSTGNNAGMDLGLSIFNNTTKAPIDLTYTDRYTIYYNNTFYREFNMVPDKFPSAPYGDGTSLIDPGLSEASTRYYKFVFTPGITTVDVAAMSNSSGGTITIAGLYRMDDSSYTNLINTTNITTPQSGVAVNSTITLASSMQGLYAFTISNLDIQSSYYFIVQSTNNRIDTDVGFAFFNSNTKVKIDNPTYVATGNIFYNNTLYTGKNIIPNTNPDGSALINPAIGVAGPRWYKFTFAPTSSSLDVIGITNSNTNDSIYGIYKMGTSTNLISTNISNVATGVKINTDATITIQNGIAPTRLFTISGLDTSASYNIVTYTTNKSLGTNIAIAPLSNGNQINIDYLATGNINNNGNIYSITNIIPDINPDGTALDNPPTTISGYRYFLFSFIASNATMSVYATADTNVNVDREISTIYKQGDMTNIINSTNVAIIKNSGISTSNSLTIDVGITNVNIATLTNLTVNKRYYLISKTVYNYSSQDIGIAFINTETNTGATLTYLLTDTTLSAVQKSIPSAPSNAQLSQTSSSIQLTSWDAPAWNGGYTNQYNVYYKLSSDSNYTLATVSPISTRTYTISSLASNTTYSIMITAVSSFGEGDGLILTQKTDIANLSSGSGSSGSGSSGSGSSGSGSSGSGSSGSGSSGSGSSSTANSPYSAPNLPHTAVEVNFEVTIEGNSNLSVFGEKFVSPTNIIVAKQTLPVNALYDATNHKSLIEISEPLDDPNNIEVQLADTDNSSIANGFDLSGGYIQCLKTFAKGLQKVLCDEFDCKNAVPFNSIKYIASNGNPIPEYTKQRDFGRVGLAVFAHYLFGHVDATSAITNDVAFIKNMLSLTGSSANTAVTDEESTGPADRYTNYSTIHKTEITNTTKENLSTSWTNLDGTAEDANLAQRLVKAVVNKGFNTNGTLKKSRIENTLSDANKKKELSYIVRQVVGQDATRLMNEDNSERTLNIHRPLRFYEGDIIYMNIKLKTPAVSFDTVAPGISKTTFENSYDEQSYTLKITLGPRDDAL
jgi:hypothetical protein